MFDAAPVTKLKPNDERTARFISLLATNFEFLGGAALADDSRPLMDPLKHTARSAANLYRDGDFGGATQAFLRLSNLTARHPRATPLIATWKDVWKISKDQAASAAAEVRFRDATAADTARFGPGDSDEDDGG